MEKSAETIDAKGVASAPFMPKSAELLGSKVDRGKGQLARFEWGFMRSGHRKIIGGLPEWAAPKVHGT